MDKEFVDRHGRQNVKEIDSDVKNKFNWSWLEEKDCNGDYLSTYIRKLQVAGVAWCISCKTRIVYGSTGKKVLFTHAKSKEHCKAQRALKYTQSIPTAMIATKSLENCTAVSESTNAKPLPYGASPIMKCFFKLKSTSSNVEDKPAPPPVPVSLADRKSHLEGLICTFIAENDLPLSSVPKLLTLAKELSKDPKALNELTMERSSASYKLIHGVHLVGKKRLLNAMRESKFSLNIDESTTKASQKKVMNVLVCYFSEELGESVTELYCAMEMTTVNASTVHKAVSQQLFIDGVPLTNLVAILTDSAAYMRGCNNGFQEKMKKDVPHLINIDGDVCHHMHNKVKHFSTELDPENFLGRFLDDIFNDFKFSADLKEDFLKIAKLLNLPALTPFERVPHRWLSIFDTTERMLEVLDILTVFYFAWLSQEDQTAYQCLVTDILKKVDSSKREINFATLRRLKSKNLTAAGKERKQRIAKKLYHKRSHLLILINLTVSILPMFKSFVLTFEQKSPQIHKIHDKIIDTTRSFLASFVKIEHIQLKKSSELDLFKTDHLLPLNQVFTGETTKNLLHVLSKEERKQYQLKLQKAYIKTGQYLLKKLPIHNKFLESLSALDPIVRGHSAAAAAMISLKEFFHTIEYDREKFDAEVKAYHLAKDMPPYQEKERLDHWWNQIFPQFQCLAPTVKACLGIFTGPRVEQSFSMMNHIITSKTNRMAVSTYEAYQAIKYRLLARKTTAVKLFKRTDIEFDPVDKSLVFHIQTAKQRSIAKKCTTLKPSKTITSLDQEPLDSPALQVQQHQEKPAPKLAAIFTKKKRPAAETSLEGAPAPKRQK